MPTITLHQFAPDTGAESASPFCVKVHRALAYKGLDYRVNNIGAPNELKRVNPQFGKLPVLEIDGELIPDSSAILVALEARFPEPALRPAGDDWRFRLWEDWADESFYWTAVYQRWSIDANFEPFAKRAFGGLPVPLKWVVPKAARKSVLGALASQGVGKLAPNQHRERLVGQLDVIEGALEGHNWIAGNQLTAADLSLFGLLRALALESMGTSRPLVLSRPNIVAWLKRVDGATTSPLTVAFEP